jgi:alpha-beta hydrolase superfamily lysophospholipase
MRLFAGDRHEILNETDRADVYADLLGWIGEHLPQG